MTTVRSLQLSRRWAVQCWFDPLNPWFGAYAVPWRADGKRIGAAVTVLRITTVLIWRLPRPKASRAAACTPVPPWRRRRVRDWADSAWEWIESLWD
ncbi:hypothetical protein [Streptomyces sp. NPDC058758]|uniref:hypothetical protein n=1 Tax=Streptomyces sp. NPDC058758 TaxID=3346627 RepID=UPI0036C62351